ncbi:LuxR family transcriptional regulator [Actinoplanes sp. SE50]|uniref:alpha/beta fold hydrolase n=1 Tax=unclassified Actinoplanes TaxID=2626549 RepID=UPI00023EBD57|nr:MULTISPECIES: alpha/beta fold hydrolase [unclassified Actinoplanes]AEV85085.1 transcriptional regulator, LuxR family [Actinoplanes sp. SE50/110]ATO83476.1 LuxR family transcriptional regulator [Actinoplanes sp. SE50]SLM00883.1 LuxR family transcriptional regulator [Actinoplanes sp. SE50/110]
MSGPGQRIASTTSPGGARIGYATVGSGPPLVFVTGWLSHLELSWALPAERGFFQALADGRRLIRYDKPGCGLSTAAGDGPHTMEREVDALRAVVDATGLERFDLVGISTGAAVAAAWAAREPRSVSRLVLYGGWPYGPDVASPEIRTHVLGLIREHWGLASDLLGGVFAPDADPGTRAAFVRYQREAATAEVAGAMLLMAYRIDVLDLLPSISAPTLVVHRERDRAAPIEQGRRLADGIPGARLEVVPGRSHLPYIGDYRPITRAIRQFLGLPAAHRGAAPGLTERQREVAALIAQGRTNREIGERLGITERSAEAHVERIRTRMDFRSRAQIAAWYVATAGPA